MVGDTMGVTSTPEQKKKKKKKKKKNAALLVTGTPTTRLKHDRGSTEVHIYLFKKKSKLAYS